MSLVASTVTDSRPAILFALCMIERQALLRRAGFPTIDNYEGESRIRFKTERRGDDWQCTVEDGETVMGVALPNMTFFVPAEATTNILHERVHEAVVSAYQPWVGC